MPIFIHCNKTTALRLSRIAVFDSGLGSLSMVRALRAAGSKDEIIYYADRANFPYGSKPDEQLRRIIADAMGMLAKRFEPDAIVVASNTPTLVLGIRDGYDENLGALVAGVRPPLAEALRVSDTGHIGVLGTAAGMRSAGLAQMIRGFGRDGNQRIIPVDCSELVKMAESGEFISDPASCKERAAGLLGPVISEYDIDTVTLSSTHLSLLCVILRAACPGVNLVDPASEVAKYVIKSMTRRAPSGAARLRVYASGDVAELQESLDALGVRRKVRLLLPQ